MVSNYDRFLTEINKEATREAQNLSTKKAIKPDKAVGLAIEIVDLVDQHRIKPIHIKQKIKNAILTASRNQMVIKGS